jgi:hypothetical protein
LRYASFIQLVYFYFGDILDVLALIRVVGEHSEVQNVAYDRILVSFLYCHVLSLRFGLSPCGFHGLVFLFLLLDESADYPLSLIDGQRHEVLPALVHVIDEEKHLLHQVAPKF